MTMDISYNWFLVSLSFLIAVFGSFTALQITNGMKTASANRFSWGWVVAAALALGGGGIWTMHFIGMLAYQVPMDVSYAPGLTFLSLLIAVVVVGAGIAIAVSGSLTPFRLISAGLFTGLGVASMHYLGMTAMVMPGEIVYDNLLVGLSVLIAVVAATVALWLAVNLRGTWQMMASAVVMAVAVCGMHYTGMAAMIMHHHADAASVMALIDTGMTPMTMGLFVFCASMILLVLCLIAALSQLSNRMYEELGDMDDPLAPGESRMA